MRTSQQVEQIAKELLAAQAIYAQPGSLIDTHCLVATLSDKNLAII